MALVDFEAAWLELADEVSGKQGIGADRLLALMKRLEVKHALEEGVAERMFRVYGVHLAEDLRAAARDALDGNAAASDPGQDPAVGTPGVPGDRKTTIDRSRKHAQHDRSARAAVAAG